MISKNNNVLMYAGNGKVIVDYSTFEQTTDSNGNKVPVITADNFAITGVLRLPKPNVTSTSSSITPTTEPASEDRRAVEV